jgi:RNA polymerase sigma-54 factor
VGLSLEQAEKVLRKIQLLDPVGVAARTLEECLLVQAELYRLSDTVKDIIRKHLKNLQKRNYNAITKDLKITLEDVLEAAKKIATLDPRPARNFTGDPPQYIVPDVYVEKVGDEYLVKINDDGMPKLKISESYRKHISDPRAKEYIKGKLRNAHWLIRSIEQRRKTIIRVTESIVEKQKEFMEKGPAFLKPMVLHDVARVLDLHESTISRVTSGKYIHTPQGIFELKYFFNTGIHTTGHEDTSSGAVKNRIKDIISGEDPASPLSDQQIVAMLAKDGIVIARRTVAKYRDMLGILPSNQRKSISV